MKDLHNHIFSNTTCISKEIMLKYINKQLSKEELHQAETHMLDCELCTDAYEGLAYAENASILFAIDSQIDQRVKAGVSRTPIMRNLMVAASVLVLVFGTYFTVDYFNKTVNKENNLALNEAVKSNKNQQLESVIRHGAEAVDLEEVELRNEKNESEAKEVTSDPKRALAEQIIMIEQDEEVFEDELKSTIIYTAEAFSADEVEDVELEEEALEYESLDVVKESVAANKFYLNKDVPAEKSEEIIVKSEKQVSSKKRKKNLRTSVVASSPVNYSLAKMAIAEESSSTEQELLVIDGYKVVNYLIEYQQAYDAENEITPEISSVSAGFENKSDKNMVDNARAQVTVEVTYQEMLEDAIRSYKNQKYKKALGEFDVILAKHSEEVNAQFYSGLCFYHLSQNAAAIKKFNAVIKNKEVEFVEEANWHKALTLINMRDITAAKKLLNEIIKKEGFYKDKADVKLKGL